MKRYTAITYKDDHKTPPRMIEHQNGHWVSWYDVEALMGCLKRAHKFIDSITDPLGPYTYLNRTVVVADAYKESRAIREVIGGKKKTREEELLEQLEYMAGQHRCGCGHPYCNRCEDDRMNQEIINKVKGIE